MPDAPPEPGPPLRTLLGVGVSAHLALPVALALAHRDAATTVAVIAGLHLLGAIAILATARWWWARPLDLAILLVADHAATFLVGAWVVDG